MKQFSEFSKEANNVIEIYANNMYKKMVNEKGSDDIGDFTLRLFCAYYSIIFLIKGYNEQQSEKVPEICSVVMCQQTFVNYCIDKGIANKLDAYEIITSDKFVAVYNYIMRGELLGGCII